MLTRILIATALVLSLFATPASAEQDWRWNQCRFNGLRQGSTWTTYEVELTIRCATAKWSVPGGTSKAIDVADCESNLNARAISDSGTYRGVYQQSIHYWRERERGAPTAMPLAPSIYNGRSNVIVSILMARGDWGDWAGCA